MVFERRGKVGLEGQATTRDERLIKSEGMIALSPIIMGSVENGNQTEHDWPGNLLGDPFSTWEEGYESKDEVGEWWGPMDLDDLDDGD